MYWVDFIQFFLIVSENQQQNVVQFLIEVVSHRVHYHQNVKGYIIEVWNIFKLLLKNRYDKFSVQTLIASLEQLFYYQCSEDASSVVAEYVGSVVTEDEQTEKLHLRITAHKKFSILAHEIVQVIKKLNIVEKASDD